MLASRSPRPGWASARPRLAALALIAVLVAPSLVAPPSAAADSCSGTVHAAGVVTTRWTMLCLINRYRKRNGLGPLRENPLLTRAAQGYALQMTRTHFFGHTSPAGSTTFGRLRAIGYIHRYGFWTVGENLGWAVPDRSSPRYVFAAWTRSTSHRANLLLPKFRDVGVGVIFRQPTGRAGVTYVVEFGVRTPARPRP